MIDTLLRDVIKQQVHDDKVAVLLSGGVDSLSVGFAAEVVLGKKVHAYSFRLDTQTSYDYEKAKEVAEQFDWKFTGIEIPTNNLVEDFHKLVELGCLKKTSYECTYPFLYVYPQIQEKYVLSGWAADGYYGISKKAMMHYKHTQELFDEFRDNYFRPDMCANYNWHKKVSEQYNKILVTPYLDGKIKEFF